MINPKLLKDFELIFENGTNNVLLPYQKGNTIRIGDYAVIFAKVQNTFKIQNVIEHKIVAETFSKTSAIALAVVLANNKGKETQIIELDKAIQKHCMDSLFYRNTIKVSKDDIRRTSACIRLDIAQTKTRDYKSQVERILYMSLAK